MAKRSGCPAKGKRPPSNPFLHGVCLTASSYPAYGSPTGSNSVGPCKRSAAGRYTSDAVPAVVPDGGINALSDLRVLHRFKQRRPAQAQRRRAIHIRRRTCGCAGWRHKCLIRPTSPFAGSNSVGTRKHSATGRYTSDAVPAVVPDGGINALSGLRVLLQAQTAWARASTAPPGDTHQTPYPRLCRMAA